MPSWEIMFWKRTLLKYVHIYTYIYKTQSLNIYISALQVHFLEWRLTCLGKRLYIYVYVATLVVSPVMLAELLEHRSCMGSGHGHVKLITYDD